MVKFIQMTSYRTLEEQDNMLKIEKDLIEIQKTIIYFGNKIIQEITELKNIIQQDKPNKTKQNQNNKDIKNLISQIKFPEGYKGNNLKW